MSLIQEIRGDANYKKFCGILEVTRTSIDLDKSMREVMSLHLSRTSRNLLGADRYSPKRLIDASLKDLSNRSRMVEIRVRNDMALSHLREAIKALRRYISTEYADDLKEFSTVDQRRSFVDRIMKSANQLVSEGEALLSTIDQLVTDIDKAGYNIKAVVSCLQLLEGSKGGRVI